VVKRDWVEYGEDNDFPNYLDSLYQSSATHHALCNGIADMVGKSVISDDLVASARLLKALEMGFVRKLARDLKIYGGAYIQVIRTKDKEWVHSLNHVPFNWVRAGKKNERGEIKKWWVSRDWSQVRKEEFKPKEYANSSHSGIYRISLFSQDEEYYPNPDYIGGLNYIALEKLISEFHLNNLENGLFPSFHIHHNNGVPDEGHRREIRTEYERNLAGAGNAGSFILTFSDGTERATTLTPIQLADSDKQYTFLSEECTKKIMIAHRVTSPLLFGIRDSSGLGSNKDEMDSAMALMEKNVISGYREIIEEGLKEILDFRVKVQNSIHVRDTRPVVPEDEIDHLVEQFAKVAEAWPEDYRLIDSEFVDEDPADDFSYTRTYAFTIDAKPSEKSDLLDRGFYRIRYQYVAGDGEPDVKETTRDFCRTMMSQFSDSIFRKEDINIMSFTRANPEFGNYSIWKYKGSYGCRHRWKRLVFFLKKVPKGESVTIAGKTYKGGQFLPATDIEHYKLLPGGTVPGKPIDDKTATTVNP
jgi:hypothetical protein